MINQLAGVSQRQHIILDALREHGAVGVDPLAQTLKVTPQTIRRDLNQLYDAGLVQRVHGGALLKDNIQNLGYHASKSLVVEEKDTVAQSVAELIPDHSSLFINIGTMNERFAKYLYDKQGILVVTNNINVANVLWPMGNIQVMVASGTIRRSDGGIVGSRTEKFIQQFKVDYAVIGCSAIDADGEVLDIDFKGASVARTIIKQARSVILVTDSMKFERKAPIRICKLSDIDYLVTDEDISVSTMKMCESHDIALRLVSISNGKEA